MRHSHRRGAQDGRPPMGPLAPEDGLEQADEEDLPGRGDPPDPSSPSPGHPQP